MSNAVFNQNDRAAEILSQVTTPRATKIGRPR
jgi:hypothetical protein